MWSALFNAAAGGWVLYAGFVAAAEGKALRAFALAIFGAHNLGLAILNARRVRA